MPLRLALTTALATALLSGCIIAPPNSMQSSTTDDAAKMSERALATCGAGNVKDVNAKSFSCK